MSDNISASLVYTKGQSSFMALYTGGSGFPIGRISALSLRGFAIDNEL